MGFKEFVIGAHEFTSYETKQLIALRNERLRRSGARLPVQRLTQAPFSAQVLEPHRQHEVTSPAVDPVSEKLRELRQALNGFEPLGERAPEGI
jgi:hypothetical protein